MTDSSIVNLLMMQRGIKLITHGGHIELFLILARGVEKAVVYNIMSVG